MTAVAQGATSTAAVPLLHIWTTNGQLVVDPDAGTLTFTIVDISTDEKEAVPVVSVAPVTVNLTTHRIGAATAPHFAAAFTLSPTEAKGAHEIRWAWEVDGAAFTWTERFDVLAGVPRGLGGGYGLVSDFRAEGFTPNDVGDVRLMKLIAEQSLFIERVTGRFFDARHLTLKVDGTDSRFLLLGQPIIALSSVSIHETELDLDPANTSLKVYNRHLREGLLDPDDRNVPQLAFPDTVGWSDSAIDATYQSFRLEPVRFGGDAQGITVSGLFGYTDPDGSPIGQTPETIRRALRLLVQRTMPKAAYTDEVFDARMAGRVTQRRVRDQSISYASAQLGMGGITGDIEIDNLLVPFIKLRIAVP